jgi:hypothetical protein
MQRFTLFLWFVLAAGLPAFAATGNPDASAPVPYPLPTCIVSGEHLEAGNIVVFVHKEPGQPDRVIRLCCRKCLAKFKADSAKYLEKLDAAAAKAGKKN